MIQDFKFKCVKVLPTVYDDSLSYYEVLCKISRKLNEVIQQLNEYDPEGVVQRVIDEKLAWFTENVMNPTINGAVSNVQAQLDNLALLVAANYEELDARVRQNHNDILQNNADIARVNLAVESLRTWIQVQLGVVYGTMTKISETDREYTDAKIARLILDIPVLTSVVVISPVDGHEKSVQNALYDLYDAMRWCALTAQQYDTMYLTAEEYDNRGLTAFDFDVYGVQKLMKWLFEYNLHSGYSGEWVKVAQGVHENTQELRINGVAAGVFDGEENTASSYDSLEITAFMYDWLYTNLI